jgi:hypothetical protein
MKKDLENLDELIKEALTKEEAAYFDELKEQNLDQQIFGLYKGRTKWFLILFTVISLIAFIISVYAAVDFFNGDDPVAMLKSGAIFFIGMMIVTTLKLFSWNQMDKYAIIREIKRMELQIAHLARKREQKD